MIYYTADTHFGHAAIIRMCNRPFANVSEMDRVMIEKWNKKVTNNDIVYVVGDFAYRNNESAVSYLKKLNGKKILILGNHDKANHNNQWIEIAPISHTYDPWFGGHHISLCHYPLVTWPGSMKNYMIFGHIHNLSNDCPVFNYVRDNPLLLNAGVDINNYEPVTLEELINNNERFKSEHVKEIEICE